MRIILTIFIITIMFAVSSVTAVEVQAQYFKLQLGNPTQAIKVGDNFDVKVLINTGGVPTINGDTVVVFDPTKLSIDPSDTKTGNFYTYFSAYILGGTNNKLLLSSWEESSARAKSTTSDASFATVNIKARVAGSTTLSFDCTEPDKGADTNINKEDYTDIVKCSSLQSLNLNIGGTSPTSTPGPTGVTPTTAPTIAPTAGPTSTPSATATPRPTSTPVPTNTPRPTVTQLPRAGTAEVTVLGLGLGALLTVVGILFIL